jgi:hypothetical protein
MIGKILAQVFGTKNERELKKIRPTVQQINSLEEKIINLTEEELAQKTNIFRERISQGESLDSILPEAFAVVREMGKRKLNMRHFDEQLIGGIVLHEGKIDEMKNSPFQVEILYLNPNYNGKRFDLFDVEGIDNAMMIFNDYRSNGHSMKLRKICLHCEGKKIKGVNFKY